MKHVRISALAALVVLTLPAGAHARDTSDHRRIQGSIYDVIYERYATDRYEAPNDYARGGMMEGRASATEAPRVSPENRVNPEDPYYFQHETQTHD